MKRVAVVLAGCGHRDGSEIREAVLSLLAIEKAGMKFSCFAASNQQKSVISHISEKPLDVQSRSIIEESARISRGSISPLYELKASHFDVLWIPGGNGVAINYSNFLEKGINCELNKDFNAVVKDFYSSKKPIVAVCIAPLLVAKSLENIGIRMTLGTSSTENQKLLQMGQLPLFSKEDSFIEDIEHLVYTTPAYMEENASLVSIHRALDAIAKKIANPY